MAAPEDLAFFESLLGRDGVVTDEQDRRRFETAARYGSGVAAAVIRPRTTQEVSASVGHCVRRRLPFLPQSANTGLVLGSTPDPTGREIIISLERLREPLAVSRDDRTVVVGAGVRLSDLNKALEPHGLMLPIDLAADPMVGGMIATNTGGARFVRYGGMRRHTLGLEVVLADEQGSLLQLGRGLRKDNSQLDLLDLFVGSCGALGVITLATLEVRHRPAQRAAVLIVPRDDDACLEILHQVEAGAGDFLSAFEGMYQGAMRIAFGRFPALRNPFAGAEAPYFAILAEFATGLEPSLLPLDAVVRDTIERIARDDANRRRALWASRTPLGHPPQSLRRSARCWGGDRPGPFISPRSGVPLSPRDRRRPHPVVSRGGALRLRTRRRWRGSF